MIYKIIKTLKSIEQCKAESARWEYSPSGELKLYYNLPNKASHLYINQKMFDKFGKSIELKHAVDNRYFEYQDYCKGWYYSEKWMEIDFFNNDLTLFDI